MKRRLLLLALLLSLAASLAYAQDGDDDDSDDSDYSSDSVQVNKCLAPASYKFDEILFSDKQRLDTVAGEYREKIYSLPAEATGTVYVFGGQTTTFNEVSEIIKYVSGKVGFGNEPNGRVNFVDGGFRRNATVVFTVRPLECSQPYGARDEVSPDELQFKEFPVSDTVRLSREDLRQQLVNEVFGKCPAVASALGACNQPVEVEVFVAIDDEGTVKFAGNLGGDRLFRSAAIVTAKSLKFRPLVIDGKPKNFAGVILIRFPASARRIYIDA